MVSATSPHLFGPFFTTKDAGNPFTQPGGRIEANLDNLPVLNLEKDGCDVTVGA
jgi:hypothetical protein